MNGGAAGRENPHDYGSAILEKSNLQIFYFAIFENIL